MLAVAAFAICISAIAGSGANWQPLAHLVQPAYGAQPDSASENVDPAEGVKRLVETIGREVSRVEGVTAADKGRWIANRVRTDPTGRIIWFVVGAIIVLSTILVLVVISAIAYQFAKSRPKRKPATGAESALQAQVSPSPRQPSAALNKSEPSGPGSSKAPVALPLSRTAISSALESGSTDRVEAVLLKAVRQDKADAGAMMYLAACCALRCDAQRYDALVSEMMSHGFNSESRAFLHVGQIGRLLSPQAYDLATWPDPGETYSGKSGLVASTFDSVMEFGDVRTLLDMLVTYTGMEDFGAARHLLVQVLVYGDKAQRAEALNYAKQLPDPSSTTA